MRDHPKNTIFVQNAKWRIGKSLYMQSKKQLINTVLIVIGGGLLLYSFLTNAEAVYFKIAGLIILMYGLYTATNVWVEDNKRDDDDENRG